MPSPNPREVHIDVALTNISVAYKQDESVYIAEKVFPFVGVAKQSDKYFVYEKGAFFRDSAQRRAPGTESAGGGLNLGTDTYFCEKWAHHTDVDIDTVANADEVIDMHGDATMLNMQKLLIRRELLFVNAYMKTGVWGTDVVGGTNFVKWSDEATSDPVADIAAGRLAIMKASGFEPNTFVVGYEVHEALKKHPLIVEHYRYTGSDSITTDMLARYFEVDKYLVSKALYTTDDETVSDPTLQFVTSKDSLLVFSAPRPSRMLPSGGYCFGWKGLTGLNNLGISTARWWMQSIKSDRVECEMSMDLKLVAADMGYFFSNAVD